MRYANVLLRATCVQSPKLSASQTQKGILEGTAPDISGAAMEEEGGREGGGAKKISYLIRERE